MASSVSVQEGPNPAQRLATLAGKMALLCLLGTTCCVPQQTIPKKPSNKSFIDQTCSVKMVGYCMALFLYLESLWTSIPSQSIKRQTKELGQCYGIIINDAMLAFI